MSDELDRDRRQVQAGQDRLGLSMVKLWIGYVAVGGSCSFEQVGRYLAGEDALAPGDVIRLAASLNEEFSERRQNHPIRVEADPSRLDSPT